VRHRCPPCKAIAPLFADLASKNSIPAGLAFAKVDVDTQAAVSKRYGISAMPTFILLEKGKVVKTVRGANPPAIKQLVAHARKEIKKERKEGGEGEAVEDEEEEEDDIVEDSTWFKDM
jgi:thioredoxin 1